MTFLRLEGEGALVRAADGFLLGLDVERGVSAHTLESYGRDLRDYLDHLIERGVVDPAAVEASHVRAFLERRAEAGLAARSRARLLSTLRGFHAYCCQAGMAGVDPTENLRGPKLPRGLPKVLAVEEVERLLAAIDPASRLASRDLALFETLYGCGLRASEACGLPVRALDLEVGLVRVRGKGDKERIVPLGAPARDALSAWLADGRPRLLKGRAEAEVFLNARGRPLSRVGLWKILRRHATAAGLGDRVTPHTLRHSFATHLLTGGADLRVVQELLGHADIRTTEIYTHLDQQHLREEHLAHHPRARRAGVDAPGSG